MTRPVPRAEERSESTAGLSPEAVSARSAPRRARTAPRLLAIDPSLRATGWLVVDVLSRELVSCGAVITVSTTPRGTRALVQQHAAAKDGVAVFEAVVGATLAAQPAAIAIECPLGAQDPSSAWAMGRSHQATWCAVTVASPHVAPISVASHAAKLYATGSKSPKDGKAEVQRAVRRLWGESAWDALFFEARITTQKAREAVYDAAAVALCALEQPAVRLLVDDHRRAGATEGP